MLKAIKIKVDKNGRKKAYIFKEDRLFPMNLEKAELLLKTNQAEKFLMY